MFLPFLTLLVDAWFAALCFPQVIYKKFQICCPLEEYSANGTASHLSYNLSSHDHGHGQEDDSHCSTYMFTMNSQVGGRQRGRSGPPPCPGFMPWYQTHCTSQWSALLITHVCVPGRRRTPFPFSLSPSFVTRRSSPSTRSSASKSAPVGLRCLSAHRCRMWQLCNFLISAHRRRECRRCPTSPSLSCTLCTFWPPSLATWLSKVRACFFVCFFFLKCVGNYVLSNNYSQRQITSWFQVNQN